MTEDGEVFMRDVMSKCTLMLLHGGGGGDLRRSVFLYFFFSLCVFAFLTHKHTYTDSIKSRTTIVLSSRLNY